MLASTVTTMQDNSAHGEDSFLSKNLGDGEFLDVVMDGVTGHGGEQASTELKEALDSGEVNNPQELVNLLSEMNADFYSVGSGRFLLTTDSAVARTARTTGVIRLLSSASLGCSTSRRARRDRRTEPPAGMTTESA